jgi:carboxyl-terminal processing protease
MSSRLKQIIIVSIVSASSLVFISAALAPSFFEVTKQLDIFTTFYRELNTYYVDTINPTQIIQIGISEMAQSLDPYTDFIPEDDIQEYRQQTTGRYGGIGSLISTRGDFVIITDPYEDFPAAKAGLRPGDKILEIDGKSAKKQNSDFVSKTLRGKAGTSVVLKIARPQSDGTDKELNVTLTREEIKIKNVPYYGILKDEIGYIRLGSFTDRAGLEVRNAMIAMIAKYKIKGLVLDLRGNPGGLLNEAINVAACFVDKGTEIVSTKGRIREQVSSYTTNLDPVDTKLPLTILVDEGSASAAEIVSGALQDLDRAVVVGEKTFGKGLVQSTHSLPYNAKLKITTAKYYIPSGRCIQAINYANKKEDGTVNKLPDSLKVAFKTKGGRIVYDGVGIEPDVKNEEDEKVSPVAIALYVQNAIFDYAIKYRAQKQSIAPAKNFKLTDEEYLEFVKYVSGLKDFKYETESEKALDAVKKAAEKEKLFNALSKEYTNLSKKLEHDKMNDVMKDKKNIKQILEQEICAHFYLGTGRIENTIQSDPAITKALNVVSSNENYSKILRTKN